MTDPLPARPNAADVADALTWAELKSHSRLFSENFEGHLRSEILHLRVQLDQLATANASLWQLEHVARGVALGEYDVDDLKQAIAAFDEGNGR